MKLTIDFGNDHRFLREKQSGNGPQPANPDQRIIRLSQPNLLPYLFITIIISNNIWINVDIIPFSNAEMAAAFLHIKTRKVEEAKNGADRNVGRNWICDVATFHQ